LALATSVLGPYLIFILQKITSITQARKRKDPLPQAQIELLDSEEDGSVDKAATAEVNAVDATEMESIGNDNEYIFCNFILVLCI
jgi:hypothetical protein